MKDRPEWFKIEVFLPAESLEKMLVAVNEAGAGHIGNYDHCASIVDMRGTWRPLEGSDPYLGKVGEVFSRRECKLEINCPKDAVRQVLRAIRANHPYEEPVINVIPLANHIFEE